MPVSILPCITPVVALVFCIVAWRARPREYRLALLALAAILLLGAPVLVYTQGLWLRMRASDTNAAGQLRYAKWLESHSETISSFVLWPTSPDVDGGFAWAEKAAINGDAEAMYIVGVRLKYGMFVPRPASATGVGVNVFPQPQAGQMWIDRAIAKGYVPPAGIPEEQYYSRVYRR